MERDKKINIERLNILEERETKLLLDKRSLELYNWMLKGDTSIRIVNVRRQC